MALSSQVRLRLRAEMPEKIGKYELLDAIGKGGMGMVYLAYDPFGDRKVAIKLSHAEEDQGDQASLYRKMFFNEVHMAGLLHHPNILSVYDAGVHEDSPYVVMEYVEDARTLKELCAPDHLASVHMVVEVAFKCGRALDYAHRKGVIHRDIKPSNVMLTRDDDVKIGDFGIAKRAQSETTQVMGMIGSPLYMSPEQVREEEVSLRTDLYSLGVVMFEMLTGRPPFKAHSFSRLIYTILNDPPPPIMALRTDLPESLERIVSRLLAKDPEDRPSSGAELAAELSLTFDNIGSIESEIDGEERYRAAKQLSFFLDFTDTEIWEVLNAAVWERHQAGDRIITEGSFEESFYVIVEGEVVAKKAGRVLGSLSAGDCFGEMGYLTRSERTATIMALDSVCTLRVTATLIEQVSVNTQLKFLKVFLRTLIARLAQTNEILIQQ